MKNRGFDVVIVEAPDEALEGARHVCLDMDIDVLDPACEDATGTSESKVFTSTGLLCAVHWIVSGTARRLTSCRHLRPCDGAGANHCADSESCRPAGHRRTRMCQNLGRSRRKDATCGIIQSSDSATTGTRR